MLRLERGKKDRVIIRLRQKRYKFDTRFWRAVLYSAAFHLFIFGFIRIQFSQVHQAPMPLLPVEVAIDYEEEDLSAEVVAVKHDENEKLLIAMSPIEDSPQPRADPELVDEVNHILIDLNSSDESNNPRFATNHGLTEVAPPGRFNLSEKLYPLRFQVSGSLKNKQIVTDGSHLFRNSTATETNAPLRVKTTSRSILYQIKIDGITGKVIEWKRKRELIDKKLQAFADTLLDEITFEAGFPGTKKGSIRVIFDCTSDKLTQYLEPKKRAS